MKNRLFVFILIFFLIQCQLFSFFDIPSFKGLTVNTVEAAEDGEKKAGGFSAAPRNDCVNIKTEIIPLPDVRDSQDPSFCESSTPDNVQVLKRISENDKLQIKTNSLNIIEFERLIE